MYEEMENHISQVPARKLEVPDFFSTGKDVELEIGKYEGSHNRGGGFPLLRK